jgi:hypothetical protein
MISSVRCEYLKGGGLSRIACSTWARVSPAPEEERHQPDIGVRHGEIAVEANGEREFAQRPFRRAHCEQDGPIGHPRVGVFRR